MDFTEQELLIERLDNWGRVYGERRAPGWRSSLLGVLREVGYRQEAPQEPKQANADENDAAEMMKMCRFERYRCYGSVTDRRGHP